MNGTPVRESVNEQIDAYLRRLDRALSELPSSRRRELVDEVSEHIREARADSTGDDETTVQEVLERLGDPLEIAKDAMERLGVTPAPPVRPGLLEVAALVLLPIGGVVLPFLGWVVGVALLWSSAAWRVRDKLIGTFLLPGGLMFPLYLGLFGVHSGTSCGGSVDPATGVSTHSCSGPPAWVQPLELTAFLVAVVIPVASAIYLGIRLRQGGSQGRS